MAKAWLIIVLLFLGGAVGIFEWLGDFAPYYAFSTSAKIATATPALKAQKPGKATNYLDETRYEFPLRFKTDSGIEVISGANYGHTFVPQRALDALEREGQIRVFYLPDDPERIRFEGDVQKMPKGWGGLVWAVCCLVLAVLLISRRHKLARYAKFLGRDDEPGQT